MVQAFSITSYFESKLMPKKHNQILMRKVCNVIQLLLHRLNNNYRYRQDHEKHYTFITFIQRVNIVHDETNVELHELLWFNAGRPLPNVVPKRTDSLALVGVQSRFLSVTAAAKAIGHVCQTRFENLAEKGQRVPCKLPSE